MAQIVAFDGPADEPIDIDDLLGANPAKLRLALQPHLTLLDMQYPLDDFVLAVKKQNSAMRSEASNAIENPSQKNGERKLPPPRKNRTTLAVHRFQNGIYYKRLAPPAFAILSAIRDGKSLTAACANGIAIDPNLAAEQIQQSFASWAQLGWLCKRRNK